MPDKFTAGPYVLGRKDTNKTYHPDTIFAEGGERAVAVLCGLPLHQTREDIEGEPRYAEALATGQLLAAAPELAKAALRACKGSCQDTASPLS